MARSSGPSRIAPRLGKSRDSSQGGAPASSALVRGFRLRAESWHFSSSFQPSANVRERSSQFERRAKTCSRTPDRIRPKANKLRSEEHTSELQSLAYLVCR